ncbi:hypothetical protein MSG28_003966 [Choristoneura fumiferana]|uniref:Uncharacterized protein n=1 Tax=Choristoneura fumiferana TaxID=7141 RepID=A0ACC0KHX4_CHOFU|nr:hypothetical protein MSG28_003966 [Choristoneura fumiferana]
MEINEIFANIKELGRVNSKRVDLREFCKLNIEQILKYLPRRILNSDGCKIVDCLLNGLSENSTSSARSKIRVVDIIIKTLRKESTSLTHCGDIISRLCLEFTRANVDELVRWCNESVQSIVDNRDVNMIWKDILPECLNAISPTDNVKHCGTEMSSGEYKEQCVRTLCQCNWSEGQLVQLAAMFNDMQLSRNDHKQVVNKICTYIIDFPPDTLPALVHQLLKLCQTHDFDIVLSHLSHYFSVRLYSKLEPPPGDSESTTMDIDDIVPHSPAELSRCLSTCIYHITEGVMETKLIRKLLRGWPKTQLLRAPFLLDIALAVSDQGDCKADCLDVIRAAIEQRECDEHWRAASAWARAVLPPGVLVPGVLKVLTTESANHRQLTVLGLISLAFLLLAVPRSKPMATQCWSHGKLILARLSKAQPETAAHILSQLGDRLHTACEQRQYADCLFVLCKLTPVSVERCSQLSTILENCKPSVDFKSAAVVLEAVYPLINFSIRTRDTLFMVCRKGLYSRDSAHRCLALCGFLTVLRHVKVSGTFSSSQSASSEQNSHASYLTQLTIVHATQNGTAAASGVRNEAVCMEVVSVMRRCLAQDVAVKQLLYTKLYDCVKEKAVLHECILEFIYEHLSKYLPEQDDQGCLLWDKCVQVTGATAILVEPIAHLLYVTAQFLQEEEEELEDILASQPTDGGANLRSKLTTVMAQLSENERLGQIDMEDPGLSDLTPESKAKSLKVQQILSCYESLIAYQVMRWDRRNSRAATTVLKLFKGYTELLEQTKAAPKLGKKGSKSSLNDTRDTTKTQKSQKSQKDKEKGPLKVSSLTKDRGSPFKPLPCVWDLTFCLRIIELLYSEEVPWCSSEQRNRVRSSREFHHWALRCVRSVVAAQTDKHAAKQVVPVAAVIYNRCICRFQDMCDFDDTTTLACVELFKECLSVIFSPNNTMKVDGLLSTITNLIETEESTCIAAILEQTHTALMQIEAESVEEERDLVVKKLVAALGQVVTVLLEAPTLPCERYTAVILKLEDYVRSSKQECLSLVPPLLTASCRQQQDAPLLDGLLDKLASALGRIDEEDTSAGGEEPDTFPAVDCRTGHAVLLQVCGHLEARYKCAEHLLLRAKDLGAALPLAAHAHHQRIDRELKELYKSIVIQLCQLTTWTSRAAKLRCCVGGGSARVLHACARLYSLLVALARLLPPTVLPVVRLERLLKLCGKKFSTVIDNLVTYLEASQEHQKARKVLSDTKLIPRLVFEAEQFNKQVVLLAAKAKVNLQQYLALGTARDFRIRGPVIEEMLKDQDPDIADSTVDNDDEAPEENLSPAESDQEDSDAEPSKKKRRS